MKKLIVFSGFVALICVGVYGFTAFSEKRNVLQDDINLYADDKVKNNIVLTASATATFGKDNTRLPVVSIPLKKDLTYLLTIDSAYIVPGVSIKTVCVSSQTPIVTNNYNNIKNIGERFFFVASQDTDKVKVYMELNTNGIDPTGSTISVKIDCLDENMMQSKYAKKSRRIKRLKKNIENIKSQLVNKNVNDKCAYLYYYLLNQTEKEGKFLFGQWRASSMALGEDGVQIDYRSTYLYDGGTVLATWDDESKRAGIRRLPASVVDVNYNHLDNINKYSGKPCGSTEEDLGWSVIFDYNNLINDINRDYIKGTQIERFNCVSAIINFWEAHNRNALVNLAAHIGNPLKEVEAPDLDLGGQNYRYISPNHVHLFKDILDGKEIWRDSITLKKWWDDILSQLCDCIDLLVDDNGEKIPVTLRLFHEYDCPYFWWGLNYNTGEEYIAFWRYSIDYIKSRCDNVLFTWCPEHHWSNAKSDIILDCYYPGDDYVDIIACDCYGEMFTERNEPYTMLQRISTFARNHGKVLALTETGFTTEGEGLARAKGAQTIIDGGVYDRLFDNITMSDFRPAYVMVYGAYRIPYKESTEFRKFVEWDRIVNINMVQLYENE